jgi:hypothetical protein
MRSMTQHHKWVFAMAASALMLSGCGPTPAEQCLDSFRSTLKDPNSGQVISFENNLLTYTATNSYGGRIQGKAMCALELDKWVRDKSAELSLIMDKSTKEMEAAKACRDAGGSFSDCQKGAPLDADSRIDRAAKELGFQGLN